jgi:RNA polymerase sigma-70 factor (ECF subfamily)
MAAATRSAIAWDDREFLSKLKSGDKVSLRELVAFFQNPVYNLAYKILWNKEDAEDVLQETFLKIIDKITDFREESSLSTWIYKIATNTALMKLRARRARLGKHTDLQELDTYEITPTKLTPEAGNPFDDLLQNESSEILQNAIENLPETYRGAFILKDVEQLPTEDVAYILGISSEALYSRLKRARMFLREAILAAYRENEELENAVP